MAPAVSLLHTWRVGEGRREDGEEEEWPLLQVHPSQEISLHKHQSPMSPSLPPRITPSHGLAPYSSPSPSSNPQFLETLPDAHILREERGSEMPSQQPTFGALHQTCKEPLSMPVHPDTVTIRESPHQLSVESSSSGTRERQTACTPLGSADAAPR